MDEYGTKAVQDYLLPILTDIDRLCRENGIEYSLMGGTLLGAVRHNGFVPWDDDIDLVFDRENYEKFLSLCGEKLPEEYTITGSIWVKRITRKDNPRIDYEEGCVDLFVFDNVPERWWIVATKNLLLKMLQGMLKVNVKYGSYSTTQKLLAFATHALGKPFSKKSKLRMYDRVSQWGNHSDARFVNNYATYFKMISTIKYEKKYTTEFMDHPFEDITVRIFRNYEYFLRMQFGDYMVLPPIEKRVPTHIHW